MVNANIWQPTQTVDPIQAQIDALYAQLQYKEPSMTFDEYLLFHEVNWGELTSEQQRKWQNQYGGLVSSAQPDRFEVAAIWEQIAALKKQLAEQQQAAYEATHGMSVMLEAYKKAEAEWQTTADAYIKKYGYVPETFMAQHPKPDPLDWMSEEEWQSYNESRYTPPASWLHGSVMGDPYTQEMGRGVPQAMPTYEAPFYGMMAGLDKPKPYLKWFESMFPKLMQRFMATQTIPYTTSAWGQHRAESQQRAAWAEWLPTQERPLFEEWHGLGPAGRGERPWSFAPRIRSL